MVQLHHRLCYNIIYEAQEIGRAKIDFYFLFDLMYYRRSWRVAADCKSVPFG